MTIELPFWLQNTLIRGSRPDDDSGNEGGSGDGEGDDGENDGEEGGEGEGGEDNSGSDGDDRLELKKALASERRRAKQLERENKKLKKGADESKQEEEKDLNETKTALSVERERTKKLAEGLRNDRRDAAILAEARRIGFIDETDALTDEIRRAIEIDQDEDDPSDIEIDEDSVKTAVGKLAKQKKHLIGEPEEVEGEPSGSKFGGRKKKPAGKPEEAKLHELYPSLR